MERKKKEREAVLQKSCRYSQMALDMSSSFSWVRLIRTMLKPLRPSCKYTSKSQNVLKKKNWLIENWKSIVLFCFFKGGERKFIEIESMNNSHSVDRTGEMFILNNLQLLPMNSSQVKLHLIYAWLKTNTAQPSSVTLQLRVLWRHSDSRVTYIFSVRFPNPVRGPRHNYTE